MICLSSFTKLAAVLLKFIITKYIWLPRTMYCTAMYSFTVRRGLRRVVVKVNKYVNIMYENKN